MSPSELKGGPRSINLVSIAFLIGGILAVYSAIRFLPAYWTQWQVQQLLRESCTKMYGFKNFNSDTRTGALNKLQSEIRETIVGMGIDDPELTVELDMDDPEWVVARANYSITIKHPFGKPSVLAFHPEGRTDTRPSDWGDKKKK